MNDNLQQLVNELQLQIDDLNQKLELLGQKRIYQQDIIPGAVKNRSMGEPNSYIYSGLSSSRATVGVSLKTTGLGCSIFWETDTNKLYIWNGLAWKSVQLT